MKRASHNVRLTVIPIPPRCLSRTDAAFYIGGSTNLIDRARKSADLPVVRYPGKHVLSRNAIFDRRDLDALIDRSKIPHST